MPAPGAPIQTQPAGLTNYEASFLPPGPEAQVEQFKQETGIQSATLNDKGRLAIMDPAERQVYQRQIAHAPGLDESEAAMISARVLQNGEVVDPRSIFEARRRRPLG